MEILEVAGCEIGVHGIYHNGRDLESWATWEQRLPEAYEAAERWDAVWFGSAALHRRSDMMRSLGVRLRLVLAGHGSFRAQNGGCCTWLPFFNGEIVELPLTLRQDHTLFVILGERDEAAWVDKARLPPFTRGGMAMNGARPFPTT